MTQLPRSGPPLRELLTVYCEEVGRRSGGPVRLAPDEDDEFLHVLLAKPPGVRCEPQLLLFQGGDGYYLTSAVFADSDDFISCADLFISVLRPAHETIHQAYFPQMPFFTGDAAVDLYDLVGGRVVAPSGWS